METTLAPITRSITEAEAKAWAKGKKVLLSIYAKSAQKNYDNARSMTLRGRDAAADFATGAHKQACRDLDVILGGLAIVAKGEASLSVGLDDSDGHFRAAAGAILRNPPKGVGAWVSIPNPF